MRKPRRSELGEKHPQLGGLSQEPDSEAKGFASVEPDNQSDSDRYRMQAEVVMRMAAKAGSLAEKDVYLSIAEGWRKLAAEALRNERQDVPGERRTFRHEDRG
jgi:hypothetical protein